MSIEAGSCRTLPASIGQSHFPACWIVHQTGIFKMFLAQPTRLLKTLDWPLASISMTLVIVMKS